MKNSMFSGCRDVFGFTLKQALNRKYETITVVLAFILFAVSFGINVILAVGQNKDDKVSPIEKVYVIDKSGLSNTDSNESFDIDKEQFPKVSFEQTDSDVEELGLKLKDNEGSVIVKLTKEKNHYQINVYIPYKSMVSKDDGDNFAKAMVKVLHNRLIDESGVDTDKITYATSDMKVEFSTVGEDAKSDTQRQITTVFPIVFMLFLYFMVVIYGQSMGQIVSIEKSSKLMETLLVTTKPYGLIFGKILATAFTAIVQIAVWISGTVIGFIAGDAFSRSVIYAQYDNRILSILDELVTNDGMNAFSTGAVILSAAAVCLAFLFYCMLAGAIASFASKAEELSSVMGFYNMSLVFGFLGAYAIPATVGQEWVKVLLRVIPISSSFLLPGEILIGGISVTEAIIYVIVLFIWIILTAVFAGIVYKDQVLYRGKSLKELIPWLKKRNDEDDSREQWQYLHDEAERQLEKSQKTGYFMLAIAPIAIFFVLQVLASFVVTNIMTRVGLKDIDIVLWEIKDFVKYYHEIENTLNPLTLMICHLFTVFCFGLWMYFIRKGINSDKIWHIKSLAKRKPLVITGVCVACGVCMCFLAHGVIMIEAVTFPSLIDDYLKMAQNAGFGTHPFAIFAAICLAPIGEELLCRGVCLHFGRKALGKFWYANILQALVFGIIHMNWVQGVYAFVIGIFLGLLVERYDSLLPAMFVHFVVNLSSSTWAGKLFEKVNMSLPLGICLVVIPSLIVATALFFTRRGVK